MALCTSLTDTLSPVFAAVMAAPVFGHAFSPYHHGQGGKVIAVSFGVLIRLLPTHFVVFILVFLPAVLASSSHPCTSDTQHRYVCLLFCIVLFSGKTGFRSSRMCSYQRNCHCKTSARTLCHA